MLPAMKASCRRLLSVECRPQMVRSGTAGLLRVAGAAVTITALLLALSGCDVKHPMANLVRGKQLFVAKCGSCHALSHAGSQGQVGPNLDYAFQQDRADHLRGSDIRGLVDYWIQYPNVGGVMPAKLVKGPAAADVAGYVAQVAAVPGQDTGALASAVQSVTQKVATEQSGSLQVDADPTGQLKFLACGAIAKAGWVTLRMENASAE